MVVKYIHIDSLTIIIMHLSELLVLQAIYSFLSECP